MTGLDWGWAVQGVSTWLAVLAVLLAAGVSTLGATRRLLSRQRARWFAVVTLTLLATAALLAVVAPPTVQRQASEAAVLVTPGARGDALPAAQRVFTLPGAPERRGAQSRPLLDPAQLDLQTPALSSLRIVGHGLDASTWRRVPDRLTITFTPPPLLGLVDPHWPRVLQPGATLNVVATAWAPVASSRVVVRLLDPAGVVRDEQSVAHGQSFQLSDVPTAPGEWEYRLQLQVSGEAETLEEPVGLSVASGPLPRFLVVQSAPSFETRQFKNWAADRGAQGVLFTRISRDRSLAEWVNLPTENNHSLTPSLLAATDLALVDGRSLAEFDPDQRAQLLDAVSAGMGLLILADSDLAQWLDNAPPPPFDAWTLSADSHLPPDAIARFPGADEDEPLPRLPYRLQGIAVQPLLNDERGLPLSSQRPWGQGRVAVSVLRDRHRWLTRGDTARFSRYWSWLSSELARRPSTPLTMPPQADVVPRPGQRTWLCVVADRAATAHLLDPVTAEEVDLVAVQDRSGASRWCAATWPKHTGWHRVQWQDAVTGNDLAGQWFRVYEQDDWTADRDWQRQQDTVARAAQTPSPPAAERWREPVPPLWPLVLFGLCASLLWWERRRDDA